MRTCYTLRVRALLSTLVLALTLSGCVRDCPTPAPVPDESGSDSSGEPEETPAKLDQAPEAIETPMPEPAIAD